MATQRQALLEAAITCIEKRGYGRTTSRDIVAAAGISSLAAIVYHYGSKEALLNEAIAEAVRRWIAQVARLVENRPSGTDGIDGLLAAAGEYYGTLSANRPALAGFIEALAQAEHSEGIRGQLAARYEEFRDALSEVLVRADAAQDRNQTRPLASLLMALADGLLIQWLLDPTQALTDDTLQHAVTALFRSTGA